MYTLKIANFFRTAQSRGNYKGFSAEAVVEGEGLVFTVPVLLLDILPRTRFAIFSL